MRDDINIYAIIKEKVTFLLSPELRPTRYNVFCSLSTVYFVDPLMRFRDRATFMIDNLVSYADTWVDCHMFCKRYDLLCKVTLKLI